MSFSMESLLGSTIQGKNGNIDVKSLDEMDTVGLYFSAHWCGPCRYFTPELTKKYEALKAEGKNFEIVFVSSDRDQKSFDEYYGEMPWAALPFDDRKRKAKLSKKFKVQGIPTLVFVNPKDGTANLEGREAIDTQEYPYPYVAPPTFGEMTDGLKDAFHSKSGEKKTMQQLKDEGNKYVFFYFSAHWCPPCRGFTPKLGDWYKKTCDKMKGTDKQFELVFVSSDRDQGSFKSYWDEQANWLALDYSERKGKATLSDHFGVRGIPSLCVVDLSNGKTVTDKGRGKIMSDPDMEQFPWFPKPADFLSGDNIGNVNESPMLIVFADHDAGKADDCLSAITPVAAKHWGDQEAKGEDPEVHFAVEKGDSGFADRLRSTLGFKKGEKVCAIFDLASRKGFFSPSIKALGDVTQSNIDEFVAMYLDEDGKRSQLESSAMDL